MRGRVIRAALFVLIGTAGGALLGWLGRCTGGG